MLDVGKRLCNNVLVIGTAQRPHTQDMHAPGDSIPFALSKADQRLYEPRAVPLGKNCGCICPGCRQPVYAKHCMSGKRMPHFAHAPGSDCATGFETALHQAAKQLIEARGVLAFPELVVSIRIVDDMGRAHQPQKQLAPAGRRELSNVVLEQAVGQIRPDVRVDADGLGIVLVEVAVTHFVDENKMGLIKQSGVPAIEIDLSALREATFEALEVALFDDPARTRWLYHPDEARTRRALRESIQWLLEDATKEAAAWARTRAEIAKEDWAERQVREAEQAARRKVEAERAAERARVAEEAQRVVDEARRLQRNEALKKAAAFKARPEDEKRQILLRRLGLDRLPSSLAADVRGAKSFGVEDPLLWQATLFGGLIHKQAAEGNGWVARNYARAWMRHRFPIGAAFSHLADDAIDDYLMRLSAAGALLAGKSISYAITVADLKCFENLMAVRSDPHFDPSRLQWAPESEWPNYVAIRVLTGAMVSSPSAARQWMSLAGGMRKNIGFPPIQICKWATSIGGTKEVVARYLIRLGFLRVAPTTARFSS
jgi:hypothetical protein